MRALCFGLLSFLSLFSKGAPNAAMVVFYTLPEFLVVTVYLLLAFHWCAPGLTLR